MGTVWRARDLVLTRDVAVKEVRLPGLLCDHDRQVLRERTLREARVSAKLNHPGVVTVYDVIEADGTPWIVMELVAARSLERVLAEDGPLPPERAAETGVMLLEALASAHAAGIVHRDVKPGNVLLTREGRAVLTDFGIATLDGEPGLTQTGMVMGTPGFCAPERIRGEPASPASDLWSLGATLYAAVEGHGPFDGQDGPMAVLAGILHSDPPPVRSAGPLGTVIRALLSRDPAQRPNAACASRMLTDAAIASRAMTGTGPAGGPLPVAGPIPAPVLVTGCAGADLAGASASTDPVGFPPFPPSPGPGRFRASPVGASLSDGTGTARFPAGTPPGLFPPSPGPALFAAGAPFPPGTPFPLAEPFPADAPFPMGASFPAGPPCPADAGPFLPVGSGAEPWPASIDPTPFPAGMDAGGAGDAGIGGAHAGARSSPGRRLLVLALAGAALVAAGLVVGLVAARVMGSSAGGQPSPGNGTSGTLTAALPAGYRWYTRPAAAGTVTGFTMAVPAGWQARQQGATTYLRNPVSGATISVSPAPAGAGGPVAEARMLERRALSGGLFTGYRRIAITPFLFRGNLAGAWRFSYRQPGTGAMDGLAVVTPTGGRGPYELMATAPAGSWPPTRAALTEAVRTFRPRG